VTLAHGRLLRTNTAELPTGFGDFRITAYRDAATGLDHVALLRGDVAGADVLVRVHSECLTGDTFGSMRCDCGEQLHEALRLIAERDRGILLYLKQEGRGIGLANKVHAYSLQDSGLDTVEANEALGFPADMRTYDVAAAILHDLGALTVRLLTNNPAKVHELGACGVPVVERVPLQVETNASNLRYLEAKRDRMQHLLALD
jgi:3,4-dihydroxy 2-butanone 4-phosphate synthase/GTP cyclohydrolase II